MALKGKITWTKPDPVARDLVKVPASGAIEAPQRGVYYCQPFLCEQDSVLSNVELQEMFYSNQSPLRQNCSAYIHGVQGDAHLPVLSPTWLSQYNSTCGWGICTPSRF
jgi:hypothetical protein